MHFSVLSILFSRLLKQLPFLNMYSCVQINSSALMKVNKVQIFFNSFYFHISKIVETLHIQFLSENHHSHHSHHQRHSPDHNHLITEHRHLSPLIKSTISTHSSQDITVWSQTFYVYLPDPLTLCLSAFYSSVLFSYAPALCRSKAPPFPPGHLDTEKDYYSQISPLRVSYSSPTHLDLVLFSFPSASFNKPVDYCTYLCVYLLTSL